MKTWAIAIALALIPGVASAAVYSGNGTYSSDSGYSFNGIIGKGSLTLNDSGGTISGTVTRGGADPFQYSLVFFIDSVAGGVANTSGFTQNGTKAYESISGVSPGYGYYQSIANFASGFLADYALVLNPNKGIRSLYQIDSTTTFHWVRDINASPMMDNSDLNFSFNWSDISGGGNVSSLKFQSTYLDTDGYRSLESYETISSGSMGYGTVTFANYNVYPLGAVPEPTNIALALFGGLFGIGGSIKWARFHFCQKRNSGN